MKFLLLFPQRFKITTYWDGKDRKSAPGIAVRSYAVLLILFGFVMLGVSEGQVTTTPVFIRATCSDKISSAVLSSLREELSRSQRYRLVHTLTDEGQMDKVLTIEMNCAERHSVAAIATVYGKAKCFGSKNCHLSVDGSSIRSDICESNNALVCGRELSQAFDSYASNPLSPKTHLD